jgi:hypothetical protein
VYNFCEYIMTFLIFALSQNGARRNCSSIYQRYQPLYLSNIIFRALCFEFIFNLRLYKPFCRSCLLYSTRRCAPRALKNACDKMVSYKTRIINNYYLTSSCVNWVFWHEWAKKAQLTHERVEYSVFLFDEPPKGSKSLKIFKISLTFRFDKL